VFDGAHLVSASRRVNGSAMLNCSVLTASLHARNCDGLENNVSGHMAIPPSLVVICAKFKCNQGLQGAFSSMIVAIARPVKTGRRHLGSL